MKSAALLLSLCTIATAQPPAAPPSPPPAPPAAQIPAAPPMDKKTIAAMMEQRGGPAEEHKLLEPLVGEFNVEIRMSMMPGQPPLIARALGRARWIFGDRFIQAETRPADDEELKISSLSTFGFDKRSKKFFWIGIDSSDTYSVFSEGDYDKDTKTFTLLGENEEPGLGKVPFKTVIQIVNDDERLFQVWFLFNGAPGTDADGWFKVMEAAYARAKP